MATGWGDDMKIIPIYKDPKTDRSGKKSATGLLKVTLDGNLQENVSWDDHLTGALQRVYFDSEINCYTFDMARAQLRKFL